MFCEHWSSFESQIENNMILFTTSRDLNKKKKITHSRAVWLSSNQRGELSFKSDSVAMWTSTHSQTRPLPFPVLTAFRGNMQRVSVSCWRWAYHGCLFMITLNVVWQHAAHSSASTVLHVCTHSTLTGRNKPPLCHFHQHEYFSSLLQC